MKIIEQAAMHLEALTKSAMVMPFKPDGVRDAVVKHAPDPAQALAAVPAPHGRVERRDLASSPLEPRHFAALDLAHLGKSGHLVSMQTRSTLAEQFRGIKRPLLRNAKRGIEGEHDPSLIMVTSSLPGEGKTFCAINLAFSIAAEIDTSVLLVDADVVNGQLMSRLGVQSRYGMLELLTNPRLALSDVVLKTNVPNLMLLPVGLANGLSTELMSSAAMRQLLNQLTGPRNAPVVVFDAPSLLATNEAAVLASQVGQVLLVVEALHTPCEAVQRSLAMLELHPIVMSVLNKGRVRPPSRSARRQGGFAPTA